jgi:hypothetical protein
MTQLSGRSISIDSNCYDDIYSTKLSSSVNAKCFKKSLPTCTALEAMPLPKLRYDRGGGGPTVPAYLQDTQYSVQLLA